MSHYPGPYKLVERSSDFAIKSKDGCILASVPKHPAGAGLANYDRSNAILFQFAPEMFEALYELVNSPNYKSNALWSNANNIIKKIKKGSE